jgi:predicted extracellular nuclease
MTVPVGTAVVLSGVVVTALRPAGPSAQGFFVGDDADSSGCALSVYTGAVTPWVQVGQRITVRGYASEYAGAPEVSEPSVELDSDAAE